MGRDRRRKREKKFRPEFRLYSTRVRKFRKKIEKKIRKLKNLFPALFLAKTGWDRPRKREKNFTPEFCSYPTRARKFEIKNSKKIQKIKKVNSDIISIQNWLGEGKNEKNKIYSRARKFQKKKAKKFKKWNKLFPALFLAKMGWDRRRKREKNFRPEFCSYSTRARKFWKK